jgi:prepilin-type N-terminal cleavage/methylation domain-containing protein
MRCVKINKIKNSRGFTLIEVIISLIIAGILAAMLVTFMGTGVMKSVNPVILAQDGAYLNSIMENMGVDYKRQMYTSPSDGLSNFKTNVETTNYYSDESHPYTVVDSYISFPDGANVTEATPSTNTILKVTVTYQDLSITALFTG